MNSRIFDVFDSNAADHAFDQSSGRIHMRSFCEEGLKVCILFQLHSELFLTIACQPSCHLVHFLLGASFFLNLGDIERIDARKAHRVDALPCLLVFLHVVTQVGANWNRLIAEMNGWYLFGRELEETLNSKENWVLELA